MSADKLATARTLIQQKRYAEARVLLETINHPTATKWLAKLDEIDPPEPPLETIAPPVISPPRATRRNGWSIVNRVIVVLLVLVVIYQHLRQNNLARDLAALTLVVDRVSAVAYNADRYAHSHGYSDAALKTDITEISSPLDRLLLLHGVAFTWNNEVYPDLHLETGRDYGLLAHELSQVFPELVSPDPVNGYLRVDYEGLIPVLVEAIREQQRQITELQALHP